MGRASLPDRLLYLSQFVDDLLRLDEQTIDESIDNTALLVALKKRVSNLSPLTAVEALVEDRRELKLWLVSQPDHPAQFIAVFLSEPADLVRYLESFEPPKNWKPHRARKPKSRKLIHMEIPSGFCFRREGSGFFLQMGEDIGARHCVGVVFDKGPSIEQLKTFLRNDAAVGFEDVVYGTLSGTRVLREGKTVTLLLRRGGVKFCIHFEGDSTLVEPFLHTLSVTESET